MRERTLRWEGCLNVRDLGGHATEDGGETLWGRVIRADSVPLAHREGWESLAAHGVRDGRRSPLARRAGRRRSAARRRVDVVHVSVWPSRAIRCMRRSTPQPEPPATRERTSFYLRSLGSGDDRFATAVDAAAAAAARPGRRNPLSAAGKDRTGLVIALLLRLAGVSTGDVADDYAFSSENLSPRWRPGSRRRQTRRSARLRLRMSATPAEADARRPRSLEREHGSIAGFLRLRGLDEGPLDSARARLRA